MDVNGCQTCAQLTMCNRSSPLCKATFRQAPSSASESRTHSSRCQAKACAAHTHTHSGEKNTLTCDTAASWHNMQVYTILATQHACTIYLILMIVCRCTSSTHNSMHCSHCVCMCGTHVCTGVWCISKWKLSSVRRAQRKAHVVSKANRNVGSWG